MTQSVRLRRRRRPTDPSSGMPRDLVTWFETGSDDVPWSALLSPDFELLATRWATWSAAHPGAVPPPMLAMLLADG